MEKNLLVIRIKYLGGKIGNYSPKIEKNAYLFANLSKVCQIFLKKIQLHF